MLKIILVYHLEPIVSMAINLQNISTVLAEHDLLIIIAIPIIRWEKIKHVKLTNHNNVCYYYYHHKTLLYNQMNIQVAFNAASKQTLEGDQYIHCMSCRYTNYCYSTYCNACIKIIQYLFVTTTLTLHTF